MTGREAIDQRLAAIVGGTEGRAEELREAQAGYELLAAQRSASEQALSETNKALEDLRREHQGVVESLQEAQHQLQTARAEAQARQEAMAAQGTAQLVAERTTQQGALESMERQYHASLEVWTAEGQQIETALNDLHAEKMERQYRASLEAWTAEGQQIERALSDFHARYDEMLRRSRDESEHFAAAVCELERRCAHLTDNRHAVRDVLESAVRTERDCYAALAEAQAQWQTKLAQALGTVGDASAHTERAVDSSQSQRPLTETPSPNTDDGTA